MNGKLQVHGHCNGLKTTLLFALMWGVIMLIWWATGGSQRTLGIYILIGLGSTFASYWFPTNSRSHPCARRKSASRKRRYCTK